MFHFLCRFARSQRQCIAASDRIGSEDVKVSMTCNKVVPGIINCAKALTDSLTVAPPDLPRMVVLEGLTGYQSG
jgi:hypothetical protein